MENRYRTMSILHRLASALDRRDDLPNLELANEIISRKNKEAVKELVGNLTTTDKDIASDCIKVLYEIGTQNPALIAPYHSDFIKLLTHKNNRLQWGAMSALNAITLEKPEVIFRNLITLIEVAKKGSVITTDNLVSILIKLTAIPQYSKDAFSFLIEQLTICPTNQLPMYAENALPVINENNNAIFVKTVTSRIGEIEKESKRKRIEKVLKKLG